MLLKDLAIITIGGTFISSMYLVSDQINQNWTSKYDDETVSKWYWLDSFLSSFFGFAVNVVWPYIITGIISNKFGLFLCVYCFGCDESFRIFWYFYHEWFHNHQQPKNIYLCIWATINDLNTCFIVPILVFFYYKHYHQKIQDPIEIDNALLMSDRNINQVNENNNDGLEVIEQPKSSNNCIHKIKKLTSSHFNKIIITYILYGLWYTIQDAVQYFYQNESLSPIYRLPPFMFTAIMILWEIYFCNKHKNKRFRHLILICCFVMCQELLFDWEILVWKLVKWTKHWNLDIAKICVFTCYTIYFKLLSFISGLLTKYINYENDGVVYQLHFIFIVYFDVYVTLFLSASTTIDWTIIYMVLAKVFSKFIKFNDNVSKWIPYLNDNKSNKQITTHYVYSLLSSCVVYIGQITLTFIDYYLYTGDNGWILSPISANKTMHNLWMSIGALAISLAAECLAFWLVFKTSNRSLQEISPSSPISMSVQNAEPLSYNVSISSDGSSIESSEYNIYDSLNRIKLPYVYFICVVAYSQISSLNATEFFPWTW